jgi:asparagine synthetase B (glutamine-hydrolysing)
MTDLQSLFTQYVDNQSRERDVALLLSGGVDSASVGLALTQAGKKVHAYTYELQGYPSHDRPKAEEIAHRYRWPLTTVTVPIFRARHDFVCLAVEENCRRKVQFEVTFPLLYLLPAISQSEVWTGFAADDHYGNTRRVILQQVQMVRLGKCAQRSV